MWWCTIHLTSGESKHWTCILSFCFPHIHITLTCYTWCKSNFHYHHHYTCPNQWTLPAQKMLTLRKALQAMLTSCRVERSEVWWPGLAQDCCQTETAVVVPGKQTSPVKLTSFLTRNNYWDSPVRKIGRTLSRMARRWIQRWSFSIRKNSKLQDLVVYTYCLVTRRPVRVGFHCKARCDHNRQKQCHQCNIQLDNSSLVS